VLHELHQSIRAAAEIYTAGSVATRRSVSLLSRRFRVRRGRRDLPSETDGVQTLGRQQLRSDRSWLDLTGNDDAPTRRLLMVHIPKTGGTSLRQMLASHVEPDRLFLSTGNFEWADMSIRELSRYTLFVGHNFLEPLYLLPDADWTTVLTVRDPRAWWQSMYSARRSRALRERDNDHPTARLSMGRWLDTRRDEQISNGQSSWLLARIRIMFDSRFAQPDRLTTYASALGGRPAELTEMLDELLTRVTVLGVTEDLQQVYLQTCQALGWRPIHDRSTQENVSTHDAEMVELSDRQRQRLHELNGLDHYLYERALERRNAAGRPKVSVLTSGTAGR
jgi:hypothetical protein